MNKTTRDITRVAPHRLAETNRRIDILDRYIRGEIASAEAMEQLQIARSTFFLLAKIWRATGRPEALLGSGRLKAAATSPGERSSSPKPARREKPSASQSRTRARTGQPTSDGGVDRTVSGETDAVATGRQRARPPLQVQDRSLVLTFCGVDVPVACEGGSVAPVAALVLDVRDGPVVLGMALTTETPSPAAAASALLDALTSFDLQAAAAPWSALLMGEVGGDWGRLAVALESAGMGTKLEVLPPRSRRWREATRILGDRPAGLLLKPDLAGRPPAERRARIPKGGSPLGLEDAEDIVRGRLRLAFPGPRRALVADPDMRARLSASLRRLLVDAARRPAEASEQAVRGSR
ncbi:hypothetical protein NF699_08175 [Sphingomonadaceae bacterium OTU29LAMAA1]|nr:hypothetical protein NF699_08175 [Sphingomonadaceae bacterium OTU29LAMAA1]